jgi:hypothetical protein
LLKGWGEERAKAAMKGWLIKVAAATKLVEDASKCL